jgi:serine/threonine-protein kinase
MSCLEKDPALRLHSATELLQALDGAATPTPPAITWMPRRSRRWVAVVALVAGAAIGVAYALTRAGPTGSVAKRIAVIPFVNVGGDSTQLYFADGVSDELTTALGRVPGVHVASRNLTYRYRGQRDVDARAVGKALDVGYVVQGTVRRAGGRLRISAQLASASDGGEVWADVIERDSSDVFRAQDEIARAIIVAVQPRLAAGSKAVANVRTMQGTSNVEAYDLYLRGRYLLDLRGGGVKLAVEDFEQAIAKDSTFARAYAGLSFALELMPYFGGIPSPEVRAHAWDAAHRALAIDTALAEAHAGLGMLYQHDYKWKDALRELKQAVDDAPDDAGVRLQYGRTLLYVGDFYAAKAQFEQARRSDPFFVTASAWVATCLSYEGKIDSAEFEFHRALQMDSTNTVALAAASMAMSDAGRKREAVAIARRMPPFFDGERGYVMAQSGNRAEAERILRALQSRRPQRWLGNLHIAFVAIGLGDTALALTALERATDVKELWPSYRPLVQQLYDPLRQSPRFAALVRRVGLDEKIFTSPNGGRPH